MSVLDYLLRNYITVALSIVSLLMCYLFRDKIKRRNIYNVVLILLVLFVSITTYIEYGLTIGTEYTQTTILYRKILSFLGYIIRPLIILSIFQMEIKSHKMAICLTIPWIATVILYSTCFYSDIVFTIGEKNNFHRGPLGYWCLGVCVFYLLTLFIYTLWHFKNEKKTFISILIVSFAILAGGMILDGIDGSFGILYDTIMICLISYMLFFIFQSKQKEEKQMDENLMEQRRITMLSQIQPHFIFNTLNTINYLCNHDPKLASKTLMTFARYLRTNMDAIDKKDMVPLEEEIEHVKAYTEIEMLRFENVHVNYDIKTSDFKVPALSIQPLVENAIKHGVRELDNGIVNVSTFNDMEYNYIVINDNGKGFDVNKPNNDGKNHIGLKNVIERIEITGHGYVKIDSEIGKGTTITIKYSRGE